jgi:hypothetical protein
MMIVSSLDWFDEGFFAFPNVPENTASGEIIIGSLYRELGLAFAKESDVGIYSIELKSRIKQGFQKNNIVSPSCIPDEQLEYVFTTLVSSPVLKNQDQKKSRDYYFFSPLIPNLANYSNVARLKGNPWNPGSYILKMIYRGASENATSIIDTLKNALSVVEDSAVDCNDDIWSRFIKAEIEVWEKPPVKRDEETRSKDEGLRLDIVCPSQRLVSDIVHLVKLKSFMTRKRWIAILEAYFRYIVALDVLWVCNVQHYLSEWIDKSYSSSTFDFVREDLSKYSFFSIGQRRDNVIQYFSKEYAKHSLLNYGICQHANSKQVVLQQPFGVDQVISFLKSFIREIPKDEFELNKERVLSYIDANEMNRITGKPGRTNNITEFLTYAPGRRNTARESQASYDQGYWYKKAGGHRGAPWLFEMGPASLTTMVYLSCTYYEASTISVVDFIEFMKMYGIELNQREVALGVTGKHLRMLGLVIDSPDAEGGIVINQPFKVHSI